MRKTMPTLVLSRLSDAERRAYVLAEARETADRLTRPEATLDYKQRSTAQIERCRRFGIAGPQPLPHHNDMVIDLRTGAASLGRAY